MTRFKETARCAAFCIAAGIDDNGHLRITDEPWLEPVEREGWIDWRAVCLVLFVIAVLAAGAWSAWA